MIIGCAAATARQLPYWRDGVTLFERTLKITGENPTMHYVLGNAYRARNDLQSARLHYQETLRLRPNFPEVHTAWGAMLSNEGKSKDAIAEY